jgi:hypothetical protein
MEEATKIVAGALSEKVSCELNITIHLSQGGIRRVDVMKRQALIPKERF